MSLKCDILLQFLLSFPDPPLGVLNVAIFHFIALYKHTIICNPGMRTRVIQSKSHIFHLQGSDCRDLTLGRPSINSSIFKVVQTWKNNYISNSNFAQTSHASKTQTQISFKFSPFLKKYLKQISTKFLIIRDFSTKSQIKLWIFQTYTNLKRICKTKRECPNTLLKLIKMDNCHNPSPSPSKSKSRVQV